MKTVTPEQFISLLDKHAQELVNLINDDLPIIIGKMAVDHFKKNFQNEAWGHEKWQEVKRRLQPAKKGYKKAGSRRKILSGETGNLGRSIQYDAQKRQVVIHSDLLYAAVHNFGLKAGRGAGFTMPKRQFIGDDKELNEIVKTEIEKQITKILNI